jgi:DNA repair protein RAD50
MSSIKKLSIQGIRSFSPNQEETIEFYSPLTMIVGANGCGKTSIIEALKYACTGALPPTCRNGQSFINDPTMTDATEVKACVKLRFTNKANKNTVCIRSMQLSKKKTKLEFKALDGCIRTVNDQGQQVSTSHKCSELDKHVPELLGVSPAIMENVIFCHQEDSSWPMGEGIVLKKKFDDVFESTRYTKALEAVMKTKKDYVLKVTVAGRNPHESAIFSLFLTCHTPPRLAMSRIVSSRLVAGEGHQGRVGGVQCAPRGGQPHAPGQCVHAGVCSADVDTF